jgi:hypothetical protein
MRLAPISAGLGTSGKWTQYTSQDQELLFGRAMFVRVRFRRFSALVLPSLSRSRPGGLPTLSAPSLVRGSEVGIAAVG